MSLYKSPYTVCCVTDCWSRITFRTKDDFYKFPKHSSAKGSLLRQWITALKMTKKLTSQMKVCKLHFKDEDFIPRGDRKVLKPNAVPSQCLPQVWRNKFHPRDYGKLIKLLEMRGIGRLRLCFEAKLGRKIMKSLNASSKSRASRKNLKSNRKKKVMTNGHGKASSTDDVVLVPNSAIGNVPVPLRPAQPDPFSSEIDIKDEPFSDQEETIEEMLAKMNDEPLAPQSKNSDNSDQRNPTTNQQTTTKRPSSCAICGKESCQCKENDRESKDDDKENTSGHNLWKEPSKETLAENSKNACGICMIGFATSQLLEDHNKTLHVKPLPRPYICMLCNESFKAKTILMEHVAKHAVINNFQCKVCSGCFPTKDELDSHFRGHRIMKREYSCRECKAVLKSKAACWDHLNLHLRGRAKVVGIPCEVCGRILSTRITLKEHMLIHSGEKPFECQLCGRKIRHRVNFLLHVQGHTLGLPHQCSSCGMSFNKKSELNLHTSKEHPEKKDYDCCICGLQFKTESRYLKHAVSHNAYLDD